MFLRETVLIRVGCATNCQSGYSTISQNCSLQEAPSHALQEYVHFRVCSNMPLINQAFGRAIGPSVSGWLFSVSTSYPTGSLGRQMSWLLMLSIAIPPVVLVRLLPRENVDDKVGYEAVPLAEAGRRFSDDEDEDEAEVRKVTGREL
jgi:hypothetical protein